MSTFKGIMAEIPQISVDRFVDENLDSEAFFLSHCHIDHMVGLNCDEFHQRLIETNRFIYLSHVSAAIIKNTYPKLTKNLVELDFYSAKSIILPSVSFSVIPIPAGHCPGSVMFLFESKETVLYTGDYRINPRDVHKFTAFYDSYGNRKKIHSVYLDTTFFLKQYEKFPTRLESLEEICSIISDWLKRSEKHVIDLKTSAKYGYEFLFIEIFKKLKMKIHVNEEMFEFYKRVPELDEAITRNKNETKIHTACGSTYKVICMNYIGYNVKTVKISAFRWKSENLFGGIAEDSYGTHFVCYSTHASYEEGVEFLKFLKPERIYPNVVHSDPKSMVELYKNLEMWCQAEPKPKRMKLFKIDNDRKDTEEEIIDLV